MINKIAVLIPSRGRPESIVKILEEYKLYGSGLATFIVGVDDDDPTLPEYEKILNGYNLELLKLWIGPRKKLGPTLNDMAVKFSQEYFALGFIGDDHRPRTHDWDAKLLSELFGLGIGFTHGDDGAWGDQLATQVFVTSNIIRCLGYMVPPGMIHMYLDNFWSDFSRAIDKFSYRGDIKIDHLHPAWGKAEFDQTYAETNTDERMQADRILYEEYKITKFDKDVEKVKKLIEENNDNT